MIKGLKEGAQGTVWEAHLEDYGKLLNRTICNVILVSQVKGFWEVNYEMD
ncbi:MAG: hypothetical protein Phog2KO_50860 [Phototrophicaceae bacterium]